MHITAAEDASPIRVLYLIDSLEIGGAEKSLLNLCRSLDRSRITPFVSHLYRGSTLASDFEASKIPCHSLNLQAKYGFLKSIHYVKKLVVESEIDIIHAMLFRANQVGRYVGHRLGIPVVSSLTGAPWDPMRFKLNPSLSRLKSKCLQSIDRYTSRWVSQFHAVSRHARDSNCQTLHIPSDRVSVIPRGREISEHCVNDDQTCRLRQQFGFTPDQPIITYVSRMVPGKNHETLVRAMPAVVAEHPNAQLLLAGDGPKRKSLEALTEQVEVNQSVQFWGWRDDVDQILEITDCFAFPSASEGLPGALIEAMLASKAIVAADIPPVREMIDDGVSGLLVEVGNTGQMADAINQVLDEKTGANRFGEKARAHAVQTFDQRVVVQQMQALYSSLNDRLVS